MQQIIVNIDAKGEIDLKVRGVAGSGCLALTRALEQELGVTTGDVKTTEYQQTQAAQNVAKARGS